MSRDENDFASKGVAGSALGIAIGGLALALLNNGGLGGGLGGLFGGNARTAVAMDAEHRLARLEAGEAATAVAVAKDQHIARLETELATCMCIKGTPMLNPNQMADPYQGGTNVLVARHVSPYSGYCGTGYGTWY